MKVEIIRSSLLRPEINTTGPQSASLPVIDAWQAYWRTLVPIFLFRGPTTEEDIFTKLHASLRKTLNGLPHLLATLEPCTVYSSDKSKGPLQRVRATWNTETTHGQFIEARTNTRIQSLLPVDVPSNSHLWDRSDKSLRALFPQGLPDTSGLRVQVTAFRCGGFSIALDLDHALADAHTITVLLKHWSHTYTQMYAPALAISTAPAQIVASAEVVPTAVTQPSMLLEVANNLPTRRPDRRTVHEKPASGRPKQLPRTQMVTKLSSGTPNLLHFAEEDYVRIARRIRELGDAQITDKVALMSVMWTAINRARIRASMDPIDLIVTKEYRDTLELPEGLTGCPNVSVIMEVDDHAVQDRKNVAVQARRMAATLDAYDREAIQAIAYDASLRDSPTSSARASGPQERMHFTSGMHSRNIAGLRFDLSSPAFCGPLFLPIDNLFMIAENFTKAEGGKWHRNGIDLYFCLTEGVLTELLRDPDLACVEQISDCSVPIY